MWLEKFTKWRSRRLSMADADVLNALGLEFFVTFLHYGAIGVFANIAANFMKVLLNRTFYLTFF